MKKKPAVCFISNSYKTHFFNEIGKRLKESGYPVFWIAVKRDLAAMLKEEYPADNILLINRDYVEQDSDKIGEFKLNELVYGDRSLRHQQQWAVRYLVNIQKPVYEFIRDNGIRFVFGEVTWAHEILIHRIVTRHRELQCGFLMPHTIRIPNGRFAFFEDEYQSKIYKVPRQQPISIKNPVIKVEKPEYLGLNDQIMRKTASFKGRWEKMVNFITGRHYDFKDPTLVANRLRFFAIKTAEEINKELYKFVNTISLEDLKGKKYVFVALHKQPESSVDVIGRYYEDQSVNIVNVWRILPDDWLVVVKEHTNAIGCRPLSFYRKLLKYRNICFIDETTDSHAVIKGSELVVTVSGTVAYEAVLMGKKALTFGPTFFNHYRNCAAVSLDDLKYINSINELYRKYFSSGADYSKTILNNSFEGIISEPYSDPRSVEKGNIDNVVRAFETVTG